MQEPTAQVTRALQPAAVFRSALTEVATKERAVRTRRPDRAQAIAGLTDRDLVSLAAEFERLLSGSADASAIAASLHATLRALSPDAPAGEVDDGEVDDA